MRIKMFNGLPVFEAIFDGEGLIVEAISIVNRPANKRDFIALSDMEQVRFTIDDDEKHIVTGLVIGVEQMIYRRDKERGEYYVHFSRETIWGMMVKFMRFRNGGNGNIMHNDEFVDDVYMIESYVKDTTRGIAPVGFDDMPDGSWFATYQIDNDEVWADVKAGKFNGFSIHGVYQLGIPEDTLFTEIMAELDAIEEELK